MEEKGDELILKSLRNKKAIRVPAQPVQRLMSRKRSQVWVETIVYTLIALSLIGLFLTFAKPKIEEIQDKSIIEQSTDILEEINSVIISIVQGGPGNQRVLEVGIKKGILKIDPARNQISFEIEGKYTYTEPGQDGSAGPYIQIGDILASTQKRGRTSTVTLLSNYSNIYDIKYKEGGESKSLARAPVPYKLIISYDGENGNGLPEINFDLQ